VNTAEISSKIIEDLKKINYLLYVSVNILNFAFVIFKFTPLLIKKSIFYAPGIKSLVRLIHVLGMMRIMNIILQRKI